MNPQLLSEVEYTATLAGPMTRHVGPAIVDIWPYVRSVTPTELDGHAVFGQLSVYVSADVRFHQVLVMTRTRNVYLVVVVDVLRQEIAGHHLLDLCREYELAQSAHGSA